MMAVAPPAPQRQWRKLDATNPHGLELERAGHASVLVGDEIWLIGGRKG